MGGQTKGYELRQFKRIPSAAIFEIVAVDDSNSSQKSGEKTDAESLNMSAGGVMFSSDIKFEKGAVLKIKIKLAESHEMNPGWDKKELESEVPVLDVVGTVVRVVGAEEIGYDIAVEFTTINPKQQEALRRFLD